MSEDQKGPAMSEQQAAKCLVRRSVTDGRCFYWVSGCISEFQINRWRTQNFATAFAVTILPIADGLRELVAIPVNSEDPASSIPRFLASNQGYFWQHLATGKWSLASLDVFGLDLARSAIGFSGRSKSSDRGIRHCRWRVASLRSFFTMLAWIFSDTLGDVFSFEVLRLTTGRGAAMSTPHGAFETRRSCSGHCGYR